MSKKWKSLSELGKCKFIGNRIDLNHTSVHYGYGHEFDYEEKYTSKGLRYYRLYDEHDCSFNLNPIEFSEYFEILRKYEEEFSKNG